jgi:hypothetical protein
MDVRVIAVGYFFANDALIAAIDGNAALTANGVAAIQGFGQRACDGFEFAKVVSTEKIGVREPSALKRALQQLDS